MRINMARTLTSRTAPRRRIWHDPLNSKLQSLARPTLQYRSTSLSTTSSTISNLEEQEEHSKKMRPWRTPVVESHGDYRQEAWLEDYIGGGGGGKAADSPLYKYQKTIPRLPVPEVSDTLHRFLPTALPFAKNAEEKAALLSAVDKFAAQAAPLQERLLTRAASDEWKDSSWLQHWWNTTGYLQVRDPVVVNVSYFFHFVNDASAETWKHRAAAMLTAVADYRKQVATGQLPAEQIGRGDYKKPLCSAAYKYMMNACRIPAVDQDVVRLYDPAVFHHAVVARHGYFFAVPLVDAATGTALPLRVLEGYLEECKTRADAMHTQATSSGGSNDVPPQLGWLTSSNRDDWARARQILCQDPDTEEALQLLESGAVLLCLDDEEPVSRQECGQLFCFGGKVVGDDENGNNNGEKVVKQGANRWFDKSIQLFCTNNGKAGLMGEHSMMDGMPVVGLANRITELTYDKCQQAEANRGPNNGGVFVEGPGVVSIFDNVQRTPQIDDLVGKAKQDYADLIGRHSLHVQSFQGYGSDFIKQAGFSPDAYVQMAMQVATYRLWGEQGGTYEATQVRRYLHGRTETTRTVSTQSAAFVNEMGMRPKMDETQAPIRKEKLRLLQEAVDAHVKYIGLAAKAQGVDRHFMGLSMLVQNGESAPDLYSDPVFARSKRWRVSTSHLTHPKFDNWGYGPVVSDGVGLAYSINKRNCIFNVTALREHDWTDKLSQLLEEALLEMRTLVEMDKPPMSKL